MLDYKELEERLVSEIEEGWEVWRIQPQGILHPDNALHWELIRMCRHVEKHGTDKLTEQQLKKLKAYKEGRLMNAA